MPDFKAISDLLSNIGNVISGITGVFGSLTGDGLGNALGDIGSDFLGGTDDA